MNNDKVTQKTITWSYCSSTGYRITKYFSPDCVEFCENVLFHIATDLALQTDLYRENTNMNLWPSFLPVFHILYLEGQPPFTHFQWLLFSQYSPARLKFNYANDDWGRRHTDTRSLFSIFFYSACVFLRIIILKSISGAVICTFWSVLDPAVTVKRLQILNRQCDVGFSGVFQTSSFLFIKTLWLYSIGEHCSVPKSCRRFSCDNS